jgi:3-dehydroquinate synthase
VIALLSGLGLAVYAPELGHRAGDQPTILRGLDEFREHLGGRLTIMLLRAIGVPFDAHEIDKGVMLGSVEVLRSLEAARLARPPEGAKTESKDRNGQPTSAESQRSG